MPMGVLRRHKVLVTIGVLFAVAVGVVVVAAIRIDSPGPASVGDALDRLHENAGDDGSNVVTSRRPPEGVYAYVGEGREELSFPPLSQQDGTEMPGTVTHRARGCWTFRIDFNAEHWQEWRYCPNPVPDGDRVGFAEVGGRTGQEWDLGVSRLGNLSTFTCDPPNHILPPPATGISDHSCSGSNSAIAGETTSAGPWRFVARDTVTVDGEAVETLHFQSQRTLSGGQDGTEHTETWFRPDGLLVRYERDIEARSDSPIGAITYTEVGSFQLARLEPRR
jgi:hypothetical protein